MKIANNSIAAIDAKENVIFKNMFAILSTYKQKVACKRLCSITHYTNYNSILKKKIHKIETFLQ